MKNILSHGLLLVFIGITLVATRFYFHSEDSVPTGDSVWELRWEFEVAKVQPEAIIRVATPIDTRFSQLIQQDLSLQGLKLMRSQVSKGGTREVVTKVIRGNEVNVGANFTLHLSTEALPKFTSKIDILDSRRRELYLAKQETLPLDNEDLVQKTLSLTRLETTPEDIFNKLFEYVFKNIKTTELSGNDSIQRILNFERANSLGKARLLTSMARIMKIPARIVTGIKLEESSNVDLSYWVEANFDNQWLSFDPGDGYVSDLPSFYIPIRKNGEHILKLPPGMVIVEQRLETIERNVSVDLVTNSKTNLTDVFDLNRLSLSTRLTLGTLLLLPLGALLTAFMRLIIGIDVFGIFTPTFFALAFIQVGWKIGAIILIVVTFIGIIGRSMSPSSNLTRVPRLSIVFILVSIAMIFCVSVMNYYGILLDGSVVLLPIVILTTMIDRIYRLADSDGIQVATKRLIWTFIVTAMVMPLIQIDALGLWLVTYPEAHIVTAGLIILMAQYKGKKWLSAPGLAWMLEPKRKKKKKETEDMDG